MLGILLGLALIGAAAWLALRPAARPMDGSAALERAFELTALPFGLVLEAAAELPGGARVVSFASERARGLAFAAELEPFVEPAGEPDPAAEGDDRAEPDGPPEVDWSAVEPQVPGGPPVRVLLVRWPPERADAERRARFQDVGFRDLSDLPPHGGPVMLERATLDWSSLEARVVRERHFRLGPGAGSGKEAPADGAPTFVDSVRADLARPAEPWMLVAIWPPRHAAAVEPVAELLGSLRPR